MRFSTDQDLPHNLDLNTTQWRIQDFPGRGGGGAPTPKMDAKSNYLVIPPQKMHEIKRIWTGGGGGGVFKGPSLYPPMQPIQPVCDTIKTANTITQTSSLIFTVRNEVAKVMFLHMCVCPQGASASVHAGIPPPGARPHWEQAPLGADTPGSRHPPSRRLLLRTVRILLECTLCFLNNIPRLTFCLGYSINLNSSIKGLEHFSAENRIYFKALLKRVWSIKQIAV